MVLGAIIATVANGIRQPAHSVSKGNQPQNATRCGKDPEEYRVTLRRHNRRVNRP